MATNLEHYLSLATTIQALICIYLSMRLSAARRKNAIQKTIIQNQHRTALRYSTLVDKLFQQTSLMRNALYDLRDQNAGQRTFEIWAKKRAADTLEQVGQ